MTWLVAHMWIILAAAGVICLLLGWSVRGMLLVGKLRRAEVDRDIARVELGEARDEIEKLFEAQRKLQAAGAAAPSAAPDQALQARLTAALDELDRTRAELEALQSAPAPVLAAAPVAAAALPGVMAAEADAALTRRAEELEARVAMLESELEAARSLPAPSADAMPEVEAPAAVDSKMAWEVDYLRLRARALEAELARSPAPVQAAAPEAEAEPAETAPSVPEATAEPAEEELARLRWRNRYLEGRLAYFEGDADSVAEEIAAEDAAEDTSAAADVPEEDREEDAEEEEEEETQAAEASDAPVSVSEKILDQLVEADARADAAETGSHPRLVRPLALQQPVAESPDDLTIIGGIGPKIQEVLNALGIYHYDQIAEWTPENIAWVDDHLNFDGRITREGWVEQAVVLVGEGTDS